MLAGFSTSKRGLPERNKGDSNCHFQAVNGRESVLKIVELSRLHSLLLPLP